VRRAGRGELESAAVVGLAVLASLICYVAGWRGTDWAAQLYRTSEVSRFGLVVWDPGWYGGTFPLNYSLLLPLVGAYIGLWPLAVASAGAASLCFHRLLRPFAPARRHAFAVSLYFAATTLVPLAIGQLPSLLGEAFALACLLCLSKAANPAPGPRVRGRGQRKGARALLLAGGGALGLAAALSAPLAGAFLALSLCAWALGSCRTARDIWRPEAGAVAKVVTAIAVLLASAALPVVFYAPGSFPSQSGDLAVLLAICAFCAAPWASRPVRAGAAFYAATSIVLFAVPNQVGDNDIRFGAYIGVPVVLYYLPSARSWLATRLGRRAGPGWATAGAAAVAAAGLALWSWAPLAETFSGAADGRSSVAAFYQPLIKELTSLSGGGPVRVEVTPTAHHWESAYLAGEFPLARGWERQLDRAYDQLFYGRRPLSPGAYRSWLDENAVSYVALPKAPLDFAATQEASLLRSRAVPGLRLVWSTPDWSVWEVLDASPLASGPATLTSLRPGSVTLHFALRGASVVKVRWSPKWSLPPAVTRWVCLSPAAGGWTEVTSKAQGVVELTISVLAPRHGDCTSASLRVARPPSAGALGLRFEKNGR